MKIEELKKLDEAPKRGMCLIYTRGNVWYREYDPENEWFKDAKISSEDILEIHLFDSNKEYRALVSESKRYQDKNGIIEHIADFKIEENKEFIEEKDSEGNSTLYSIYAEKCFLENVEIPEEKKRLTILNKVIYNENNGMVSVDDYRLIGG